MKRQRYGWVLLILLAPMWSGCGTEKSTPTAPTAPTPTAPSPPAAPSLTSLTISGNLTLTAIGETTQLTATVRMSDNTTQDVTAAGAWSVDPRVATINNVGLLTVVGFGAATVSFQYQPSGTQRLFRSTLVTASPPGTVAIFGRVAEPGAGGVPSARVIDVLSGRSVTSEPSGSFTMAALPRFPAPLKAEKDGYEPADVEVTTSNVELRLQRVVRVVAGEKVTPPAFAPNDLTYIVSGNKCSPCRLVRVVVEHPGTIGVRVTWSPGTLPLSLFVDGRHVLGSSGELTADVAVTSAREVVMHVGSVSGGGGRKVPFTVETSVR